MEKQENETDNRPVFHVGEQQYCERAVNGKPANSQYFVLAIVMLLTLVGVYATVFLYPVLFPIIIAGGFIIFYLAKRLKVEFEYIYIGGDIEIAKIFAKEKRKVIATVKTEEVQSIRKASDPAVKNDLKIKADLSKVDCTEQDPEVEYYAVYADHGKKKCVYILDLDEKFLAFLKSRYKNKMSI